jgi:hypothetical protein
MRKFALSCSVLCLSATMFAQSTPQPQRLVSEVNFATPKAGMAAQFEAGRKAHSAFHSAQKDTWNIYVWEITTGERSGSYLMTSPGHHWADFDGREAFNKLDQVDVAKNLTPYVSDEMTTYSVLRDDLSLTKPPATPAKMRTATYYTVIPSHLTEFTDAIKKINAATQKMNDPTHASRWYQNVSGSDVPQFVVIVDRPTWADMEPVGMTMDDLLKAAYGDDGAKILDQLRASCAKIRTEMSVYRPDLSYVPK